VDRVVGTVDGLKKFISIKESPFTGSISARVSYRKCCRTQNISGWELRRLRESIQVYKDVDYSGMPMPDHVPQAPNDPGGQQFSPANSDIFAL
jgi:hypothetical protein